MALSQSDIDAHQPLASSISASSRLERMLYPRSVAVIGASRNPAKRGFQAISALLESGYDLPIYPVNPAGGTILGIPVFKSIQSVPAPVDLALVATPAELVPDVIAGAAAAGVAGAVVLAVGFGETGPAGHLLEKQVRDVVASTSIRVIGPNTSGLFNTHAKVNLVGVANVPVGPISVLTQSGNMLLSLIADMKAMDGPGFATYVGVGNQTDVSYDELLLALADDDRTNAVAVHCEGFQDGRAFLRSAAAVVKRKPVVLLKGGRSEAGRRSALSHTGAIAGSAVVADAVLRQAGVEVATRSDELATLTSVLATTPLPVGDRVAVLADGGGHATLASDALTAEGLPLATLSDRTQARLRQLLGTAASVTNPVDVAGATDRDPALFGDCAKLLFEDDEVDMVLVVGLFGGYQLRFGAHLASAEETAAHAMSEHAGSCGKPLLVQTCYASERTVPQQILRRNAVPILASIDAAARCCAALVRRSRFLATAESRSSFTTTPAASASSTAKHALTEPDARVLLADAGIPTGGWRLVTTVEEARDAVVGFDAPCALKIVSPDIVHKSDVGGVRLNVTVDSAGESFIDLFATARKNQPDATIDGVLVTPMAYGVELIIGGVRDQTFGPLVAFGAGGTLVELLHGASFRAAPLTTVEAHELLGEEPVARLLDGYRGAPSVDRSALAALLVTISQLMADRPEIVELDINPVLASGDTFVAADARIVVSSAE